MLKRQLIEDVATASLPHAGLSMPQVLSAHLAELPPDSSTLGTKIAQINRQGPELWRNEFSQLARKHFDQGKKPFLVGHAALVGLPHYVRIFNESPDPIRILLPKNIDAGHPIAGYEVWLTGPEPSIDYLGRDFTRPEDAMIVEDTIKTGGSIESVLDFWFNEEGVVVTDAQIPSIDAVVVSANSRTLRFDERFLDGYTTPG